MARKPEYFQFQPSAFLTDPDYIAMSAEARGCYCTLIFYLYQEGGKLKNNLEKLARICNLPLEKFNLVFVDIKYKFLVSRYVITHKRVTIEIEATKKRIQVRQNAGVIGANARWQTHSNRIALPLQQTCDSMPNNNNNNNSNASHTHIPATGKFTLAEVKDAAVLAGLTPEQAEVFYNHYNGQGWLKGNGLAITDLPSQLASWKQNRYNFEGKKNDTNKKPQTAGRSASGGGFKNAFR